MCYNILLNVFGEIMDPRMEWGWMVMVKMLCKTPGLNYRSKSFSSSSYRNHPLISQVKDLNICLKQFQLYTLYAFFVSNFLPSLCYGKSMNSISFQRFQNTSHDDEPGASQIEGKFSKCIHLPNSTFFLHPILCSLSSSYTKFRYINSTVCEK